jgi:hypothetical protein
VIWFRHADPEDPFLWEEVTQAPARWHGEGEGPVQYLSDTPDGAWAEFLRHEEITDVRELEGVRRALWAVEVPKDSETVGRPRLFRRTLRGGLESYEACREEARRLLARGATAIEAPGAALRAGAARGQLVRGDNLVEASALDGRTLALFGPRPEVRGWLCADSAHPTERVLALVNHF